MFTLALRCTSRHCNVVARGTYFEVSYVLIDMDFARHSLLWTALPPPTPQTPLSIKRTLYGSSQTRGILFVSLSNDDHVPITVGYLETLLAFVTPWIHPTKVNVGAIARGAFLLYPLGHFYIQYCTQMTSYWI